MKILLVGSRTGEIRQRLDASPKAAIELATTKSDYAAHDLIIDTNFEEQTDRMAQYADLKGKIVLVAAVKTSLLQAVAKYGKTVYCHLVGLNALPTFAARSLWEISLYNAKEEAVIEPILKELGIDYQVVEDRVGMVTPRIICMIINEAHYTLQEGTATIADIDLAMKLGTNYPYGPFEWMEKIGVQHVYEVLEAVYEDTRNERYRIAPLLKRKYLENKLVLS